MFSKNILKLVILTILLTGAIIAIGNSFISLSTHACDFNDTSCRLRNTNIGNPYPMNSTDLGGFAAPRKWQPVTVAEAPANQINLGGIETLPSTTNPAAQSSEATRSCLVFCNENKTTTTTTNTNINQTTTQVVPTPVAQSSAPISSSSSSDSSSSSSSSTATATNNDNSKPIVISIIIVTAVVSGFLYFIKKQLKN